MAVPQYGQVPGTRKAEGDGTLEETEHHPQGKRCLARPTPFPGPGIIASPCREAVPARRLESPYFWRAFVATHIPQATASSSVSCSKSHTPDQGPSLFRMTGSL